MLHKDAGGNPLLSRRKMNIPVRFHPEKKGKSGREEKTLLRLRCVQKGPRCKSSLACVGTKEKVEWMQRGLSPARIGNGVVSVFINGIEAQLPFFLLLLLLLLFYQTGICAVDAFATYMKILLFKDSCFRQSFWFHQFQESKHKSILHSGGGEIGQSFFIPSQASSRSFSEVVAEL